MSGVSIDIEEQYDKIYRYCYFRLRSRQTAEDLTQETFLRYLEKYQGNTAEQALRCLYTIARNLCVDEYRRRSRDRLQEAQRAADDEAAGVFTQEIARNESSAQENTDEHLLTNFAVRAAVAALEPDEQELLLLRYVNEVPVSTLAQLMEISRFAVRRRLLAVTKKFRENLKKEGIE